MPGETRFPMPQWSTAHRELRRKGVTLALLWQEYKEAHPQGMQIEWSAVVRGHEGSSW